MKLKFNLLKKNKDSEKENSKILSRILVDYLSDYFENVEFDFNFGGEGFTFLAKEVEFRKDLLQKFGIPLELSIGKIKVIKLLVKSLIPLKNIEMEISDITIEIQTIHISKDYKTNFLNYRRKFLHDWETKHKKFFNSMAKPSYLETIIINKLIQIKVDVKNIVIRINDSISSTKDIKQLEIIINSIHSVGDNENSKENEEMDIKNEEVYRKLEINGMSAIINKKRNKAMKVLGTLLNEFDLNVNIQFFTSLKSQNLDLKKQPKFTLKIEFTTELIVNLSVPNIKILKNLFTYLIKVKTLEKYWVNRPEIHVEGKISQGEGRKWFKYSFRVLRDEIRKNKRRYELPTLIDKFISMEKYIQFYKESHKLIIAPWINQKDHKNDLLELENKMGLDDIIFCRELAFAELITEGRAFCASGEVGKGYKPFVHLWEFYVNDLRRKWMNKEDNEIKTIKLTENERRELMKIWKRDRDMVLLSYIKGEPNHPQDIVFDCTLKVKNIIVNFETDKVQYKIDYSSQLYDAMIKEHLSELDFVKSVREHITDSEKIEEYLKEELSNRNYNDSDDEGMQSLTQSNIQASNSIRDKDINNKNNLELIENSISYIDERNINHIEEEKYNIKVNGEGKDEEIIHAGISNFQRKDYSKSFGNKSKIGNTKTLFSVVLFSNDLSFQMRRNNAANVNLKINSFHFMDHNLTFINVNKNTATYNENKLKEVFEDLLRPDKNKSISSDNQNDQEEVFNEWKINFLMEILKNQNCRRMLLSLNHEGTIYYLVENTLFDHYEDCFDFKYLDKQGQGLTSLNKHFSDIVIDYLINKDIFAKEFDYINDIIAKQKKKSEGEESKELLKKALIKAYEDDVNPEKKKLYEGSIQEKFIERMTKDLNKILKIISILLIKYVISALYPYLLKEKSFSQLLLSHLEKANQNKDSEEQKFLSIELTRKGREYPNYIMTKTDQLSIEEERSDTKPDIVANISMKRNLNITMTNELLAEMQLILPEISQNKQKAYVGNILYDLTRSHLKIFDDFRQLRAKLGVLNKIRDEIECKDNKDEDELIKIVKNKDDKDSPIEIIYLDNLTNHLKKLANANCDLSFNMGNADDEDESEINIEVYDKLYFIENQQLSFIGLKLKNIEVKNTNLESLPNDYQKRIADNIHLPKNFDLNKLCNILFLTRFSIGSIEIAVDNIVPMFKTDFKLNKIYSLIENTPFIPDKIIDAHSDNLEINIYPSIEKMLKNIRNLSIYKEFYSPQINKIPKPSEQNNNLKKIIDNNLRRFIRNLNIYFKKEEPNGSVLEINQSNTLEFYLEKRNNSILTYSIGHISDEDKGIILKVYSSDKSYFNKTKDESSNVTPFFNFICDFMMFNQKSNLFYKTNEIWLRPIQTSDNSESIRFNIELVKCEPFTFSPYEYIFCQNFIDSIKDDKISFGSKGKNFPYENNLKLTKSLNLNCLLKQRTFYYENLPELRTIYLNNFSHLINNYDISKQSQYLSNFCINIDSIEGSFVFNNNKDLIQFFYEYLEYQRMYKRQAFRNFLRTNQTKKDSNEQREFKVSSNQSEFKLVEMISVHVNEVIINKINLGFYYYLEKELTKENPQNLQLNLNVENIKYIENLYNIDNNNNMSNTNSVINNSNIQIICENGMPIQQNSSNSSENRIENSESQYLSNITKASFSLASIELEVSIPKNFDNINELDSPERVQIINPEYIKDKFKKMKNNPNTQNEKIILSIKDFGLTLNEYNNVCLYISKSIQLGFVHNNTREIDEYIFWAFPYPSATEKEIAKVRKRLGKIKSILLSDIDNSITKSIEIKFQSVQSDEQDSNLEKFKDEDHFSNFKKMIYIIKSTFDGEMFYSANATLNIISLDLPSRTYDYIYYVTNWKNKVRKMIKETTKEFAGKEEEKKEEEKMEREQKINEKILDNMMNYYDNINNNKQTNVPLNDNEKSIMISLDSQVAFVSLKQDNIKFSRFVFLKSSVEYYINSHNKRLIDFSCVDFHWYVNDSKCNNLFIKKNPNDIEGKIIKLHFLLDSSNATNAKGKTEHPLYIELNDCKVVFLMKYFNECLNFLDKNEECILEFPLKSEIWNSILPLEKSIKEMFYFELKNLSVVIPESSQSANFILFECKSGNVKLSEMVDEIKIVDLPEKPQIIDKNCFYGLNSQNLNFENCGVEYNGDKHEDNKGRYFYIVEMKSKFKEASAIMIVNKIVSKFMKGEEIVFNMKNPKSLHVATRVYEYYWKKEKKKRLKLKNEMKFEVKKLNVPITVGNIFAIEHFIDNNFDEHSPVFKIEEPLFKHVELKIDVDQPGNADVNVFKVFKDFFDNSKEIERIGKDLPGYDGEIIYDTNFNERDFDI